MQDYITDFSLVIPFFNEEECIGEVLEEAREVLESLSRPYEIIAVDDGSTDHTPELLQDACAKWTQLRAITLRPNAGQSAAFGAGFQASRGRITILMDGDGQNDPQDIPKLIDALEDCDACCGIRVARRDTWSKRVGSRIANAIRSRILDDGIKDTGCSLKAIRTEFLRELPMHLRGMHRFLPALLNMQGAVIQQVPVHHRTRLAGTSKYTNMGRLAVTVSDMFAVRWMQKRHACYRTISDVPESNGGQDTGKP